MYFIECGITASAVLKVIYFIKELLKILCFMVPILLIVMLTVDLVKNVIANRDDDMKKNLSLAIKRIIMCVALFLVPTIVSTAMSLLGEAGVSYADCISLDLADIAKIEEEESIKKEQEKEQSQESENKVTDLEKPSGIKPSDNGDTSNNLSNLENAKSYKKIKILKNLTSEDLVKKVAVVGKDDMGIAQSFCIAGDNYITAQINSSSTKTLIQVYDKNTGKRKNSIISNFDHANGMTYNENENKIYLAHGKNKKYSVFSNNNIENINKITSTTKNFSRNISAISYDKNTNQYYVGKGYYVYVYDNNFKLIRTIKKLRKETPQDIGGYKGIIFVIVYQPNNSTANNAIDLYRASDGSYLGSYNLKFTGMELESIDYDDTNNIVSLYFQKGGMTDYIYTTNKIDIK